jgi:EAL domain-containing protein (putative c-di-GMP-specific phosphodiesterase class I)
LGDLVSPNFRLHVNVSVRQLEQSGFGGRVRHLLAEYGLDTSTLTLEIAESVLIGHGNAARRIVDRIRNLGVDLALDDFGKGYSSLAHLGDLNLQSLKIDRSCVANLDSPDRPASSIVRHVVALAHELGMTVVAEGVETAAQRDILTALGCDVAQGYLFARPMPARSFPSFVDARYSVPVQARLVSSSG